MMNTNIKVTPYAPKTVGHVMSQEPLMLSPMMRAREALVRLRQFGMPKDFMANCYVVDENYTLLGLLTVRDLIMAQENTRLDQAMTWPVTTLTPEDDQERAAQLIDRMELIEIPVVDQEMRLLGTFTADDAIDVFLEETTEDMELMAAIHPSERPYLQSSVWSLYRNRILWLLLLMISATFTGAIITSYEAALAAQVILTSFIPMLMDTGGNSGSQASVTIIRGLSLGEIKYSDMLRVAWKEMRVGILCGVTLAVVNFLRLFLLQGLDVKVSLVVSLTLIVTVLVAKLLGCFLPIIASRMNLDPAVMASPLITTVVDAVSLMVYFRMAILLLHI